MSRDQRWFELRDWRPRVMDRDAWIVLRATRGIVSGPEDLAPGHEEEHFALASASIPVASEK
jgi:hypothetical protein